MMFKLVIPRTF